MLYLRVDVLALALLPMMAGVMAQGAPAQYAIDIDDIYQDCENGKPLPAVEMENFESLLNEDGSFVNGVMKFGNEYNDPIEMKIYSTRQKQGAWVEGEISRDVSNVCPLIKSSSELWYPITSFMEQQECPYASGHVENFNMIPLGDMGFGTIPETFAGNWRVYVETSTQRGSEKVTECFRVAFSIVEDA